MKKNDYYVIGSKKKENGATIFKAGETDNGYCYKDEQAIKKHKGVCYIREIAFENGELRLDSSNLEDEIENGDVVTWDSAYKMICRKLGNYHFMRDERGLPLENKEFVDYLTESVLLEIDWCGFDVMLEETDFQEEWELFNEMKRQEHTRST